VRAEATERALPIGTISLGCGGERPRPMAGVRPAGHCPPSIRNAISAAMPAKEFATTVMSNHGMLDLRDTPRTTSRLPAFLRRHRATLLLTFGETIKTMARTGSRSRTRPARRWLRFRVTSSALDCAYVLGNIWLETDRHCPCRSGRGADGNRRRQAVFAQWPVQADRGRMVSSGKGTPLAVTPLQWRPYIHRQKKR
jgi:hypothetical protein